MAKRLLDRRACRVLFVVMVERPRRAGNEIRSTDLQNANSASGDSEQYSAEIVLRPPQSVASKSTMVMI